MLLSGTAEQTLEVTFLLLMWPSASRYRRLSCEAEEPSFSFNYPIRFLREHSLQGKHEIPLSQTWAPKKRVQGKLVSQNTANAPCDANTQRRVGAGTLLRVRASRPHVSARPHTSRHSTIRMRALAPLASPNCNALHRHYPRSNAPTPFFSEGCQSGPTLWFSGQKTQYMP